MNEAQLNIREPAVVRRAGKVGVAIDLAAKIEDEVTVEGCAIVMHVHYSTDSSYIRRNNYWFPLSMRVTAQRDKKIQGQPQWVSFWKRDSDGNALVMVGMSNAPENNFEGTYQEALEWTIHKIKENINQ